jgi:periplasmic copper chaperone A
VRSRRAAVVFALMVVLAACGREEPAALTATEITAYAPLPGQPAGVAYFWLTNSAATAVTLRRVTSPEFARVEMHTTLVDDGLSRMTALDSLTIAEHSGIAFAPGGPHLMLMEPVSGLDVGDVVTLEFHFDYDDEEYVADDERQGDAMDNGLLAVRAPLQAR